MGRQKSLAGGDKKVGAGPGHSANSTSGVCSFAEGWVAD